MRGRHRDIGRPSASDRVPRTRSRRRPVAPSEAWDRSRRDRAACDMPVNLARVAWLRPEPTRASRSSLPSRARSCASMRRPRSTRRSDGGTGASVVVEDLPRTCLRPAPARRSCARRMDRPAADSRSPGSAPSSEARWEARRPSRPIGHAGRACVAASTMEIGRCDGRRSAASAPAPLSVVSCRSVDDRSSRARWCGQLGRTVGPASPPRTPLGPDRRGPDAVGRASCRGYTRTPWNGSCSSTRTASSIAPISRSSRRR